MIQVNKLINNYFFQPTKTLAVWYSGKRRHGTLSRRFATVWVQFLVLAVNQLARVDLVISFKAVLSLCVHTSQCGYTGINASLSLNNFWLICIPRQCAFEDSYAIGFRRPLTHYCVMDGWNIPSPYMCATRKYFGTFRSEHFRISIKSWRNIFLCGWYYH